MTRFDLPVRYYRFFPAEAPLGETERRLTLNAAETVLLLIDVYHAAEKPAARDLVSAGWDRAWWQIVDEKLVPLIAAARSAGLPIVYTMNSSPRIAIGRSAFGIRLRESLGFDPQIDFTEESVDPIEFDRGEPIQLVVPPQIAPEPDDYYVRKHTYSGFFETRLDSVLRNLGARTLLCAGFVADCCVLFTVADAVFRGYQTILMRDCTLAAEHPRELPTFARTERTITQIETFFGPSATAADVAAALAGLGVAG